MPRIYGVLIGFLLSVSAPAFAAANITNFSSNLPLLHVNTGGKAITAEDEIPAKITLIDRSENRSTDLLRTAPNLAGKVNIRGNSSAKFAKKQFDLELVDSKTGKKAPVSLLGMPAHHKWVLAAPYADRALIRNTLGFAMARSLRDSNGNSWWAPRTQMVELFLNGKYHGVYTITEKIDGSDDRANIGDVNEKQPEKSPFIVKVEKTRSQDATEFFKTAKNTVNYSIPKAKDLVKLAKSDASAGKRMYAHIQGTMNRFEDSIRAIKQGDLQSYRKTIDVTSFQNFIYVHEIMKNIDGFRRSIYLQYKNGRVHLGPVWDFDLAGGNLAALGMTRPTGFMVGHSFYIDFNHENFYFRYLLRDPAFQADLVRRWHELRRPGQALSNEAIMHTIDAQSHELIEAQARNFTVWNYNGQSGDGIVMKLTPKYRVFSHAGVVNELKNFLQIRLAWLDQNIQFVGNPSPANEYDPAGGGANLILHEDLLAE